MRSDVLCCEHDELHFRPLCHVMCHLKDNLETSVSVSDNVSPDFGVCVGREHDIHSGNLSCD